MPGNPGRTTAAATVAGVVSGMPAFMTGAAGVLMRADIGFDEAGLGAAISVFFGASGLAAVPGGRLAERLGARYALFVGVLGNIGALLSIALFVDSLRGLLIVMFIGGSFNGLIQTATSLALARGVKSRQAFMFGIKQSAIPAATLLAGLSVPAIGLTVGWRWAFAAGALLGLAVPLLVPRDLDPPHRRVGPRRKGREGDAATAPLLSLAISTGFGTATGVAIGSFLVESAVAYDISVSTAGYLLAVGSVVGIMTRLSGGWLADRKSGIALLLVAGMMVLGAGGYFMLGMGSALALMVGTVVAYSCGWGWTGLVIFAVVRLNPNAPAAATGIISMGQGIGAAIGPVLFGWLVTLTSFQTAWTAAAGSSLLAGVLTYLSRGWLLRDRDKRQRAA